VLHAHASSTKPSEPYGFFEAAKRIESFERLSQRKGAAPQRAGPS